MSFVAMKQIASLFASLWLAQGAKFQTLKEESSVLKETSSSPFEDQFVGLKSAKHNRFVQMKQDGSIGTSGVSSTLPDGWTLERFKVVNVGGSNFGLHNTEMNRFLTWNGAQFGSKIFLSEHEHGRGGEDMRFQWVSMWGYYQIYHPYTRRFLRMDGGGALGVTNEMGWQELNGVGGAASQGLPAVRDEDWTVVTSTFTATCGSRYIAKGASCKADVIGKTVGLRSHTHSRFMRMTNTGVVDAGPHESVLFDNATWERFEVVDVGKGEIALHNTHQNRFITMTNDATPVVTYSKLWNEYELPIASEGERFKVVDAGSTAGHQEIAFHNARANRFLSMNDQAKMEPSGVQNWDSLPASWTWKRFQVHDSSYIPICGNLYFHKGASCKAWLIGQTVAFFNPHHQRFMQMAGYDWGPLTISAQEPSGELCNGCTKERFDVVDLGEGYVGLYHTGYKRYVFMSPDEIEATAIWNKEDLPAHYDKELFRVVDLGNNEIGLHNPFYNRFLMMGTSGMVRSSVFNWDALPANHDWERFTVEYTGTARGPEQYTTIVDKRCRGHPYTNDGCDPNVCNGWSSLTETECWEKCRNGEAPAGCKQDMHCVAAVSYAGGWCHLFSVCPEYENSVGQKIFKRVESPFLLQVEAANVIIEKPELEALDALAVAIPLAIINVSNFSGLVSSKNLSHLGMQHHFGNYLSDVALLLDKAAGFYTALHKVMGADADIHCPKDEHQHIEKCLKMAACAILPAVEAGTVPLAFHTLLIEQIMTFDISWQNIMESFVEENESYMVPPEMEVPSKYQCDLFKPMDVAQVATAEGEKIALLQDDEGSVSSQTFALSAALADAFRSTDEILSSHMENSSIQSTMQRFEELWSPICQKLDCDPSNYWDIHLSSYKQTMGLMQIGKRATSHAIKEIIHRAKMQRNFQKVLMTKPSLVQLFRSQVASEEQVHAYARAAQKSMRSFLKKFAKAPGGEAKVLELIDLVEYRKFQEEGFSLDGRVAHVVPSGKIENISLVDVQSRGIWDFLKNLVKCFGSFTKFYSQGYSKSFGSRVAANVGFSGGDSVGLTDLIRDQVAPTSYIGVYASVTAGTATKQWWAGLSVSFSVSLGCANNAFSTTVGITVGAIGCAVTAYNNPTVCPFGAKAYGFSCSQSVGGSFSTICCNWNLRTGDNSCR